MAVNLSDEEKKKIRYEAYCASFTDAWVNTNLEKDKAIFTISSGAIGLLVTLMVSFKVSSVFILYYFLAASLFYLICIIIIIFIFGMNADYAEMLLNDKENTDKGKRLSSILCVLDRIVIYFFIAGLATTVYIAAERGFTKLNEEVPSMADKPEKDGNGGGKIKIRDGGLGKGGTVKPGPQGTSK